VHQVWSSRLIVLDDEIRDGAIAAPLGIGDLECDVVLAVLRRRAQLQTGPRRPREGSPLPRDELGGMQRIGAPFVADDLGSIRLDGPAAGCLQSDPVAPHLNIDARGWARPQAFVEDDGC
jgi:hypothetical protein